MELDRPPAHHELDGAPVASAGADRDRVVLRPVGDRALAEELPAGRRARAPAEAQAMKDAAATQTD